MAMEDMKEHRRNANEVAMEGMKTTLEGNGRDENDIEGLSMQYCLK